MARGSYRENERPTMGDCALCKVYWMVDCKGCPIAQHTEQNSCKGTPYMDAYRNSREEGMDSEKFKTAAVIMLNFLKLLKNKLELKKELTKAKAHK